MSNNMPSKLQGKVKTAAEVDRHIHRKADPWRHIINHCYKHACGSSLLSFTGHGTNPLTPQDMV